MKNTLTLIASILITWILVFLTFAFIELTFDFTLWTQSTRIAFIIFALFSTMLPIAILDIKKRNGF